MTEKYEIRRVYKDGDVYLSFPMTEEEQPFPFVAYGVYENLPDGKQKHIEDCKTELGVVHTIRQLTILDALYLKQEEKE